MARCVWCQNRQADAWYCDGCGLASGYIGGPDLMGPAPSQVSRRGQWHEMLRTEYDHFITLSGLTTDENYRKARRINWDVRLTQEERRRLRGRAIDHLARFGSTRVRYKKRKKTSASASTPPDR